MSSKMNSNDKSTPKPPKRKSNFWRNFVMVTGAPSVWLYFRTKVYYAGERKNCMLKGKTLLISNHNCFYDPIIVCSVFWTTQLHFLATKDLYQNRFLRWFLAAMHCIEVDKDNFNMRVFRSVADAFRNDYPVLVFPEGVLNSAKPEETLAFKSGSVLMAHAQGAPILPLYIVDRKRWYNRYKLVVGDEIDVREMLGPRPTMQDIERVNQLLHDRQLELRRFYEEKQAEERQRREKRKRKKSPAVI